MSFLQKEGETFFKNTGRKPKVVVVYVGDDPASAIYTGSKVKKAQAIGFVSELLRFPKNADPHEVFMSIESLNADPSVDGILIQRPLPPQFQEAALVSWIDPSKDVDAFHPENVGKLYLGLPGLKPCTPCGSLALLDAFGFSVKGLTVGVIGRSAIVGKPLAALCVQQDATVVQMHSKTRDLRELAAQCDVVFSAVGKPGLLKTSSLKKGAIAVDIGIHRLPDGKITGDIEHDAPDTHLQALTPVPGGVGPMTITLLLTNTLLSAQSSAKLARSLDTPIRAMVTL